MLTAPRDLGTDRESLPLRHREHLTSFLAALHTAPPTSSEVGPAQPSASVLLFTNP
jgi:hypothetical protein